LKDKLFGVGALPHLAIEAQCDCKTVRTGNFIGGCKPGADGSKAIAVFAAKPLLVLKLQVARAYIVHDGVSGDVLSRVFYRDSLGARSHDQCELSLVIHLLADGGEWNRSIVTDGDRGQLGEKDGRLRRG